MKGLLLTILLLPIPFLVIAQSISVSGTYQEVVPDVSSALNTIYIVKSLSGTTLTYESATANDVSMYEYQTSQNDKQPVLSDNISVVDLDTRKRYTISGLNDSHGYLFFESGLAKPRGAWVVDYSVHQPVLASIEVIEDVYKCEALDLYITKSDALVYYGLGGQQRSIVRQYDIEYESLKWNDDKQSFEQYTHIESNREIGTDYKLTTPPLIDTQFILKGDQFGKAFGMPIQISSLPYRAVSTQAHIVAEQERRDNQNESGNNITDLGGSAPVNINFYGYGNEPVSRFYTWLIYDKRDISNPVLRYTDRDIKYQFDKWGEYKVILEVTNQSASCISRDSVEFKVQESMLDIPNFFSPSDSPGVNDEFRVAYKSLISFKCTIFNRWGNKLYEWRDPAKGWDGRYKGKFVNPGVYFYVIEAKGSDNVSYKRKGAINIVRGR